MSRIDQALRRAALENETATATAAEEVLQNFPAGTASVKIPVAPPPQRAEIHDRPAPPPAARREAPLAPPVVAGGPGPIFSHFDPTLDEKLVVSDHTRSLSIEQYRRLAAALHHAQTDRGIKIVMVASALSGEGKTLTSTNLALTLSESYRRTVLLVDADLRRPMMHEVFQVPNTSGLNEGLRADDDRRLPIVEISPRLSVLPAGRPDPDPMGGLTSERMARVLKEAAARFDWVILDTPPVALMPDANLLAAMVDVAVLVIGAGQTPYHLIQRAAAAIGRDRIIGVVLNRATDQAVPGVSYYGQYYRSAPEAPQQLKR
jgi:capsular exopolysaccharide synthesis family protein